jgi:chemotaxis protein methyltransferase CheR
MLLDAEFSDIASWKLDLYGTDLSTSVIERARAGRFSSLEINRGLPATHLVRYFRRDGAHFVISDALRSRVRFDLFNLAKPWPPMQDFDIILLRNVLIYFDEPTKRRVLEAARAHLRPRGYLMMGTAETTRGLVDGFTSVPAGRTTIFRREEA